MIQVIDYKAGNLTSVVKALRYLGAETHAKQSPDDVRGASKIVLPGMDTTHVPVSVSLRSMSYTAVYTGRFLCSVQLKCS